MTTHQSQLNRRDCLSGLAGMVASVSAMAQCATAAANPRSMIRLLAKGQTPAPATLADAAWLEGHWVGEMPNAAVESIIYAKKAGQMPGFVRALQGGSIMFYEIMVFGEVSNSLYQRVKHFSADLAGMEDRDAYVERPLVAKDETSLFFDGSTFTRTGPDSFTVYHLYREGDKEIETIVVPFRRRIVSPGTLD